MKQRKTFRRRKTHKNKRGKQSRHKKNQKGGEGGYTINFEADQKVQQWDNLDLWDTFNDTFIKNFTKMEQLEMNKHLLTGILTVNKKIDNLAATMEQQMQNEQ